MLLIGPVSNSPDAFERESGDIRVDFPRGVAGCFGRGAGVPRTAARKNPGVFVAVRRNFFLGFEAKVDVLDFFPAVYVSVAMDKRANREVSFRLVKIDQSESGKIGFVLNSQSDLGCFFEK